MTTHAADRAAYPVRAARRDVVEFEGRFVVGADGAVASSDVDDPAVTATHDDDGVYDLTFPSAPKGRLYVGFMSPAGTVWSCQVLALDPVAGTAQIAFYDGASPAVATEPAADDEFWVFYRADSRV